MINSYDIAKKGIPRYNNDCIVRKGIHSKISVNEMQMVVIC